MWDFGPGASETSRVVELDAGYYYATLQWRNANGDSPVSDFSEALTVGADGRSARINTVYRRAAAKPAALASGPDRVPAGTFDDPPDGADPLWLNTGVLDPAAAVYVWNGWMSGATPLDPPTVAISVAGDDVRVVVTDPADADDILGHVIRLQREEPDGDWLDVFTRTHIGQTTAAGRGKTFPELDGTYRALAQVVSLTRAESKWVTSAEVTAVQATDVAPDQGAPPVLRYIEGASPVLRVTAEPPDARGSPLTNGTARLYRDGVLAANLIAQDTTGPLQGWVWDFGPGASETSRVVELDAGYYYATLQWRNANGDSPVSDFSEALTVGDAPDLAPVPTDVAYADGEATWTGSALASRYLVLVEFQRVHDDVWVFEESFTAPVARQNLGVDDFGAGRYGVSVASQRDGEGDSEYSARVEFIVGERPSAELNPVAMIVPDSADDICIEWTRDPDANDYEIEVTHNGAVRAFYVGNTATHTLFDQPDGAHAPRVRAWNDDLAGAWHAAAEVVVDSTGRPAAGGEITAAPVAGTDNDADLTWDAVAGATYRVRTRCRPAACGNSTTTPTPPASPTWRRARTGSNCR